jgi:hypothetical protein
MATRIGYEAKRREGGERRRAVYSFPQAQVILIGGPGTGMFGTPSAMNVKEGEYVKHTWLT